MLKTFSVILLLAAAAVCTANEIDSALEAELDNDRLLKIAKPSGIKGGNCNCPPGEFADELDENLDMDACPRCVKKPDAAKEADQVKKSCKRSELVYIANNGEAAGPVFNYCVITASIHNAHLKFKNLRSLLKSRKQAAIKAARAAAKLFADKIRRDARNAHNGLKALGNKANNGIKDAVRKLDANAKAIGNWAKATHNAAKKKGDQAAEKVAAGVRKIVDKWNSDLDKATAKADQAFNKAAAKMNKVFGPGIKAVGKYINSLKKSPPLIKCPKFDKALRKGMIRIANGEQDELIAEFPQPEDKDLEGYEEEEFLPATAAVAAAAGVGALAAGGAALGAAAFGAGVAVGAGGVSAGAIGAAALAGCDYDASLLNTATKPLTDAVKKGLRAVGAAAKKVADKLGGALKAADKAVKDAAKKGAKAVHDAAKKAADAAAAAAKAVGDRARALGNEVGKDVAELLLEGRAVAKKIADGAKKEAAKFRTAANAAKAALRAKLAAMKAHMDATTNAIKKAFDNGKKAVGNAAKKTARAAYNKLKAAKNKMVASYKKAEDAAKASLKKMGADVKGFMKKVKNDVGAAAKKVTNFVRSGMNKVKAGVATTNKILQILAKGAANTAKDIAKNVGQTMDELRKAGVPIPTHIHVPHRHHVHVPHRHHIHVPHRHHLHWPHRHHVHWPHRHGWGR